MARGSVLSPSGWHDDARRRDAGHDELQASVYRFEKNRSRNTIERKEKDESILTFERSGTYFECPFFDGRRIVGFADVLAVFRAPPHPKFPDLTRDEVWICFEIKPVIESVGAVVRQCAALKHLAYETHLYPGAPSLPSRQHREVRVVPIVPAGDPKFDLLKEFWPFATAWKDRPL